MPTLVSDDLQTIDQLLGRVMQLHSAPQVAQRVLHLTRDLEFQIGDVVSCLESDPALAAKILRIVNSSHFGLGVAVGNLHQAVALLGQRALRLVTMTFSLVDTLTRGPASRMFHEYWQRTLTMAVVAARLSDTSPVIERDTAYTAGLFADLGVLVLAQLHGERYTSLYHHTPHGPDLVEAERKEFGCGHPALGARLLERWQFPAELVTTAAHHHDEESTSPLETAVHVAHLMSEVLWNPASPHLARVRHVLQRDFGVDIDGFISLVLICKEDLSGTAQLFEINLAASIDCQALLEEAHRQHLDAALEAAMQLDSLVSVFTEHTAPSNSPCHANRQPLPGTNSDSSPQMPPADRG